MTDTKFYNLTNTALYKRLAACLKNAESNIIEASGILTELKRRGENHPLMRNGMLKWFEHIEAGTLNPQLVIDFLGEDQIISRMIGVPMTKQKEIASTGTVRFVEERKGEIVEVDKQLIRMNLEQLNQVFDNGRIRTVAQQTKIVKSMPRKTVTQKSQEKLVGADVMNGVLVIGRHNIEPSLLIEPLRQLGYKLIKN